MVVLPFKKPTVVFLMNLKVIKKHMFGYGKIIQVIKKPHILQNKLVNIDLIILLLLEVFIHQSGSGVRFFIVKIRTKKFSILRSVLLRFVIG